MEKSRWAEAQHYEKNWWLRHAEKMNLRFYEGYAEELLNEIGNYLNIVDDTVILEIGSGAAGILTFLKSKYRFAIDPLEDFYATIPKFLDFRDPNVNYYNGKGEELPFERSFFDFIIMDNVLDHCDDPHKVMDEMNRVLKNGGIVFFRQNTYHGWGKFAREVLEHFKIDKGHPHTFTKRQLQKSFSEFSLNRLKTKRSGYFRVWLRELTSGRVIDFAKALLFATRDKTLYILQKSIS